MRIGRTRSGWKNEPEYVFVSCFVSIRACASTIFLHLAHLLPSCSRLQHLIVKSHSPAAVFFIRLHSFFCLSLLFSHRKELNRYSYYCFALWCFKLKRIFTIQMNEIKNENEFFHDNLVQLFIFIQQYDIAPNGSLQFFRTTVVCNI